MPPCQSTHRRPPNVHASPASGLLHGTRSAANLLLDGGGAVSGIHSDARSCLASRTYVRYLGQQEVRIRGRMGHRIVSGDTTRGQAAPGEPVVNDRAGSRDGPAVEAGTERADPGTPVAGSAEILAALARMEGAVDQVAHGDLDELSDRELDALLGRLRRPLAQLEGFRARAAAMTQRRKLAARGPRTSIDGVLTDHRRALGEQQRLAPGEVQRVLDAGRAATDGTATGRAVTEGRIGVSQARTIARVLETLIGAERDAVEVELVELAERLDPVAFGKAARRIQGRVQPEVLTGTQQRQELQRRFRATDTEDGGFAFSGLLYGSAAETARVALRAFRRPDAPGEQRTPDQRGADAFEQLCATALATDEAPTRHGSSPQVIVMIDADELARLDEDPAGVVASFASSGQPITGPQFRHLLQDCQLVRMVVDADAVPIEVSTTVRTVPAGLWRALVVRDRGCRWPGCDAPASWCDVAHGRDAYADDGRLRLDNALLLCRRHHRRFDRGPRHVIIDGTSVSFPGLDPP
jgi:hypothetical protein